MDFEIPEELRMLQTTVRRFVQEELIPRENEASERGFLPDDVTRRLQQKVRDLGLWALGVPEEYGGGGIGALGMCLFNEEAGKTTIMTTTWGGGVFGGATPPVLYLANEQQKEKYLLPVVRGDKQTAFAMTEPDAGSDPGGMMRTTAVRDGNNWVINGSKIFISWADLADFVILFAVTDREKMGRGGISCFIVDKDTPGFKFIRVIPTMGYHYPSEILFDNCVVSNDKLLGELGRGFALAQIWLGQVRMSFGGRCVGLADRCLKAAIAWSQQRVTFGQPLAKRQAVQWMIADSALEIHAARLMSYHGACKVDRGEDVRMEASMVKLFGSEMVNRVIDRTIQIHGGLGYTKDLPFERMYRDVRVDRIMDGASEIQRMIIARQLLGREFM